MSDLDAMREMMRAAGLPELSPWQERIAAAMLDGRWGQVVVTVPQQSGRRAWAATLERALANAKAPATMGDGGRGTAG